MSGTGYPWDLRRVPNYESAPPVAVEEAERLEARTFQRHYVLQNRPCLIKRAAVRWPAFKAWPDPEYLPSKIGRVQVRASCRPKIEAFGLRSREQDAIASERTRAARLPPEELRHVLPRVRTPDDDVLFVELSSKTAAREVGADLSVAGARFPFLPASPSPRYLYANWGIMFFKNSYSDWHFHPGADAVMCQLLGTKDVLLLPPTRLSWDQIVPVHREQWEVYDVDLAKAPAYRDIRPYHVIVEPGDGLFLPVNWWHAVQARPREYGITVPVWWDSAYRDLRQPATRHHMRVLAGSRPLLACRTLLGAVYGTVASQIRARHLTSARG